MNVGKAIFSILSNNSDVAAIVRTGSAPSYTYQIFPLYAPQTLPMPMVTYQALEPVPTQVKESTSPLDVYTVQVNSIAETYDAANDLATKVRAALDRATPGTYSGVPVQFISYQGGSSQWTDPSKLEGAAMISHDYLIRVPR